MADKPLTMPTPSLSPRHSEVASLLAEGLFAKQIARQLGISSKTVRTHISHACKELGIPGESRLLAIWWIRRQDPLVARLRYLSAIAVCPQCGSREPRRIVWAGSGPRWAKTTSCQHEFHAVLAEIAGMAAVPAESDGAALEATG